MRAEAIITNQVSCVAGSSYVDKSWLVVRVGKVDDEMRAPGTTTTRRGCSPLRLQMRPLFFLTLDSGCYVDLGLAT